MMRSAVVNVWGFIRRWRVLPLLCLVVLSYLAWYIGIRTDPVPSTVHSLGVVARVVNGYRIAGANVTAGSGCEACGSSPLIRYNPGAGLRVDMVVSVDPNWFSCGSASVDMVISGTPAFWREHDRLGTLYPPPPQRPNRKHRRAGGQVAARRHGGTASPAHVPAHRSVPAAPVYAQTQIALGWDPETIVSPPANEQPSGRRAVLVSFLPGEPQTPLHPSLLPTGTVLTEGHSNIVTMFPPSHPFGLRTRIYDWAGTPGDVHEYTLQVRFTANWVRGRGFGNCYVLIPSLLANGAFAGTQDALEALVGQGGDTNDAVQQMNELMPYAQAPSFGRVALATTGSLDISDSSPQPQDFESVYTGRGANSFSNVVSFAALNKGRLSGVWSCTPADDLSYLRGLTIPSPGAFAGSACSAVAVVYAQGASSFRAFILIIFGVLIALAVERLFVGGERRSGPSSTGGGSASDGADSAPETSEKTSPAVD
jgi:hypothetical protein